MVRNRYPDTLHSNIEKRLFTGLFALALLATVGYGVQKGMKSEAGLSDLALANVEALAQNESGGSTFYCFGITGT